MCLKSNCIVVLSRTLNQSRAPSQWRKGVILHGELEHTLLYIDEQKSLIENDTSNKWKYNSNAVSYRNFQIILFRDACYFQTVDKVILAYLPSEWTLRCWIFGHLEWHQPPSGFRMSTFIFNSAWRGCIEKFQHFSVFHVAPLVPAALTAFICSFWLVAAAEDGNGKKPLTVKVAKERCDSWCRLSSSHF